MTRERGFPEDHTFREWIRNQERLDSKIHGLNVTDIDWIFHDYKESPDGCGIRDCYLMMLVESKTRGGLLTEPQREALFMIHQQVHDKRKKLWSCFHNKKISVWNFGYFVLLMSSNIPTNEGMNWCFFDEKGNLIKNKIDIDKLIRIVGFYDDPYSLEPMDLRRHHKTKVMIKNETTPMGFIVQRLIKKRS